MMSDTKELEPTASEPVSLAAVADRRRPGRLAQVNPELLPLLRGEPVPAPELIQFGDPDQLRGVRGLPLAIAVSAALWAGIAYAGRLILS
jgi:hypothetical protein